MAGDRTAILFDELRRQLGEMGDVSEELHFQGPAKVGHRSTGWGVRRSVWSILRPPGWRRACL